MCDFIASHHLNQFTSYKTRVVLTAILSPRSPMKEPPILVRWHLPIQMRTKSSISTHSYLVRYPHLTLSTRQTRGPWRSTTTLLATKVTSTAGASSSTMIQLRCNSSSDRKVLRRGSAGDRGGTHIPPVDDAGIRRFAPQ